MKTQKILIIINLALLVIAPVVVYACVQQSKKTETEQVIPKTEPAKTTPKPVPIATGKITTIADGIDVQKVNLWSSTDGSTRRVVKSLRNGDRVVVWKDAEPYYQVESASKDGIKGYCMKGFVIIDR